jgi:hypothetical protein
MTTNLVTAIVAAFKQGSFVTDLRFTNCEVGNNDNNEIVDYRGTRINALVFTGNALTVKNVAGKLQSSPPARTYSWANFVRQPLILLKRCQRSLGTH